jgi:pimeloyl-ACP methyl ester carboxylesterase
MASVNFNYFFQDRIIPESEGYLNQREPVNTYIIIHGFQNTGGNAGNGYKPTQWMTNIATALWRRENDANIILVDWEKAASGLFNYEIAARSTGTVGSLISDFLRNELFAYISDPGRVTLIGHSLGAQVAGAAGRAYQRDTGKKLGQIIGLDPAGPAFEASFLGLKLPALAPGNAERVVALHTSQLLGYNGELADLDIYTDVYQNSMNATATEDHGEAHTILTLLLRGAVFPQSQDNQVGTLSLNTLVNSEQTGRVLTQARFPNARTSLTVQNAWNSGKAPYVIAGALEPDMLIGGIAPERFSGGGGNDILQAGDGNDILNGGTSNDTLYGEGGNDVLYGDTEHDILIGSDGKNTAGEIDSLKGGEGRDVFVLGNANTDFYLDTDNNNDPFNSNPFASDPKPTGNESFAIIQDYLPGVDFIQVKGPLSNYSLAPVSINISWDTFSGISGQNPRTTPFDTISGTGIYANKSSSLVPNPFDPFLGFDNLPTVPLGEQNQGDLIAIVRNVSISNSTGFFDWNPYISLTKDSFISISNDRPVITVGTQPPIDDSEEVFTISSEFEGKELGHLVYDFDNFFETETLFVDIEDQVLQQTDSFFHNIVGLYEVKTLTGAILDTFDSNGNGRTDDLLNPEDAGYALTAISNRVSNFYLKLGDSGNPTSNTLASELDDTLINGGKYYAPFIIANGGKLIPVDGTIGEGIAAFLAQNPNNQGATLDNFLGHQVAYFSFGSANPDGAEHLQSRGNNIFGFEDLPGNLGVSDFDFNDAVFKFDFG